MEINEKKLKEKAEGLGKAIGQTEAARAMDRAREALQDDEEAWELFQDVQQLQEKLLEKSQQGEEVSEEKRDELQDMMKDLESNSEYQQFVSAQMNFDKLMKTVNEHIQKGIEEGEDSKIIEL
jgi:cell fate (sporulation/competence/biofilm development) regulator YlbF (YheA/YmcA/DUF963 family)